MQDLLLEYMDQVIDDMIFEDCAIDILNETADEETLKKIREKAAKKISTQIAASAVNYDNLKLQISKDKKINS